MGLPQALNMAVAEMMSGACLALQLNPLLTQGQIEALEHHASDDLKALYLPKLISGEWSGTMNLTEPGAGSDVGALVTKAEPNGDGTYRVTGQKIYITWGDSDVTENVCHLVLARLPGAPTGTKGISLFMVPKFIPDENGRPGVPNDLRVVSLEHKLGIHGSPTCVMSFEGAKGWLVGQEHKGMAAMFTMMNTARLAVGLQGLGLSDRALQNANRYARERLQSRAPGGARYPDKAADPIVVQPDVRRMLLTCRALVEGGRLLGYHAVSLVDVMACAPDEAERKEAAALVDFLTPIVKACLTEWGVECTYHALQCFGGHGYIREHGMEQLARDARITTLYEGTTGIQALDLVGRKLLQLQGEGLRAFLGMIESFCRSHGDDPALQEFIAPLRQQAQDWAALSQEIAARAQANPDEIGAASVDYLFYSGYVALAYWWARSVAAAEASAQSMGFKAAKRETARFYFARILPRTLAHRAAIDAGAATLMVLPDEAF